MLTNNAYVHQVELLSYAFIVSDCEDVQNWEEKDI